MLRPLLLLLTVSFALPAAAQGDPRVAQRERFVEAMAGVALGRSADADDAALRSYDLYPYLQAERLSELLRTAPLPPDELIGPFIQTNGDAPWTRSLRVAWLRSLAQREDWSRFMAFYLPERADTASRCEQTRALIATGADPGLRNTALEIYRTGAELPAACAPVVDWLDAQGALTLEEIAGRARLALEAGKPTVARMLVRQLPQEQRGYYSLWADLLEDPQSHLERGFREGMEPRAVFDGFSRLARKDQASAELVLGRIEAACGKPCRLAAPNGLDEKRREVGLNYSWSRQPEAVATFRLVPDSALDERGHEWRVRAALWAGDWELAAKWTAALPPELAQQQRWRYWRARSDQKLGRGEAAGVEYERLALENGYYSVLASERLDRPYAPRAAQRPTDLAAREGLAAQPGFIRAREAFLVDRLDWARTEWTEATRGFDAPRLLEASRLAASWGWMIQAVGTATRAEVFDDFELLYPRPFAPEVSGAAKRSRLPPEWIYAVMRQESLYDPRARSSADALGLLQLLPTTARAVARRNGLETPSRASLFDPATNVQLGAAYLREQLETFGDRFVLVLGAYNAGPNAVRRWLPERPLDTDVWIENVPFNETRNYIQRIVWNSTVFAWKASGKPQRITRWLTPISSDLSPLSPAAAATAVSAGSLPAPP